MSEEQYNPVVESAAIDADELMAKYDKESAYRRLTGFPSKLVFFLCVAWSVFQLYTGLFGTFPSTLQRAPHLAAAMTLVYLLYPISGKSIKPTNHIPVYDYILALASVGVGLYHIIFYDDLLLRAGAFTKVDIVVSCIAILLLLEAARRVAGMVVVSIGVVFLLYAFLGNLIPRNIFLFHAKFTFKRVVCTEWLSTEGILGSPIYVSSTFIFLFMVFATFLKASGVGDWMTGLATATCGGSVGGPAKAAVVASALQGTVSGSSVANVVSTGSITIPLMKKTGYPPYFAGAVEATASTGGQIMPPVMGAVAFLMAEMTGIEYSSIALAALVPALLYYATLSISVYFIARRDNIAAADPDEIQPLWQVFKTGWPYAIPLVVLVALIVLGFSVQMSAFYSIWVTLAVGFIMNRKEMTVRNILKAFESTVKSIAPVAAACILAGIIMGSMSLTGFGLKISSLIEQISGGNLLFTLLLAMFASVLLGMGLPTSAAYMVLAVLVAPALIDMGVSKMAAHLFLLYFGALSTITPPVALSVFAACGISGAGVWETGWDAIKLASTGFIIPFIFALDNSLLLIGPVGGIVFAVVTAFLGCIILSMAVSGWMLQKLNVVTRLLLLAAGVMLINSAIFWLNIVGAVLAAAVIVWLYLKNKKAAPAQKA